MSKLKALLTREVIEHRIGMIAAPAIIMTLMTALTIGTLAFGLGHLNLGGGAPFSDLGDMLDKIAESDPLMRKGIVVTFLSAISMPALMILPIVMFFILLGALYEERRDRSFLFWKSMPVSDTVEVLVKLAAAMLLAPLAFLLVGVAFQIVILLLVSIIGGIQGGPVASVWQLDAILLNWLHSPFYLLVWGLWALPVYAWVLLAGSFAPRAPFMFAVVPPVALIVIEEVLLDSQHFARWIGQHITGFPLMQAMTESVGLEGVGDTDVPDFMQFMASPDFGALFESFSHGDFWLGIAIAAVFTYGAVWFRRYSL